MPDQKTPGPQQPPRGSGSAQDRDFPRGPQIKKSFLVILVLTMVALLCWRIVTAENRAFTTISFYTFQEQYWREKEGKYVGLRAAELKEEVLTIWPEIPLPKEILNKDKAKDLTKESSATSSDTEGKKTSPEKSDPKTKPVADEKTDNADKVQDAKTSENAATTSSGASKMLTREIEQWYRIELPARAIDSALLLRLGTIKDFKYSHTNDPYLREIMVGLIWLGLVGGFAYFFILRGLRGPGGPGNVLSFGRSRPKLISREHTAIRFDDVAGIDEAKEEVTEFIEFLKNPDRFARLGGRIPRGLLFEGPPGTGKTLLAKAIAGEAGVPFYSISGSDFVEMFVGVGASRVRDLFRQAKDNAPCIIFLDEVDAVGRRRGSGLGGGHDEREQTLNAILVEMDGFDTNEQVIVIAATNRPDVLDPALLRPGRFDREIVIDLPDLKGRYEILKVHARHVKLRDGVDLMKIARGTPMFSGADLQSLINEAAIHATMKDKEFIDEDDLEDARDKVRFGRQKRSREVDEQDRFVAAYHEAGHAIVTRMSQEVEPLHKVTIIPRGMAGGMTMSLPNKDRYMTTRRQLIGHMRVLFGGRIAEQMFCEDISTGASNDIERATSIARRMVCDFGMSDALGPIRYANKEQHVFLGGEMSQPREFSEATAELIDQAVRKLVDQAFREAEEMLETYRGDVELVAKALLRYETLSAKDVDLLIATRDMDCISRATSNGQMSAPPALTTEERASDGKRDEVAAN